MDFILRYYALCWFTLQAVVVVDSELMFELHDNEKQCFYEEFETDQPFSLEFQVISGGSYDVDCFLTDPLDNSLFTSEKSQYETFRHTTTMKGVYKVCFSNEFSVFTHKVVYFDFRSDLENPLLPDMTKDTALTQLESTSVSIHEILKAVIESQTWHRLREAHDRIQAEDLHERVTYWSFGETFLLLVVSVGQVFMLKSFFTEKKGTLAATT
ncbi:transmembrane emp24 domain-containing protein 3 [Genypterus blacodes]|uniref:transmembrane emp24 domain-containing protein 3 n=1 Tax=Genypterus blacodes TaxID=154954 RepID=UPI003F761A74